MKLILKWLIAALAVLAAAYFVPGIGVESFWTALIVALFLGILSVTVKPVLLLVTLPINLVTLGLFTFIINALLFWLLTFVVKGFTVDGFLAAFLGALLVAAITTIAEKLFDND